MKRFLRRLFTRLFRIGYDVPFRGRMLRFDVPVDDYFEVGDLMVVCLDTSYMEGINRPYMNDIDPRIGQNIIAYDEKGQEVWRIKMSSRQIARRKYKFFKLWITGEDETVFSSYYNLSWCAATEKLTVTKGGYKHTLDPATGEIIASEWLDKYG